MKNFCPHIGAKVSDGANGDSSLDVYGCALHTETTADQCFRCPDRPRVSVGGGLSASAPTVASLPECDHLGRPATVVERTGLSPLKQWRVCEGNHGLEVVGGVRLTCPCDCGRCPGHSERSALPDRDRLIAERERFIAQMPAYPEGQFAGRGAVMLGGGRYEASAFVTIQMLRACGWQHPIELWYRGHEETRPSIAGALPGVTVRDTAEIRRDGGWQSKMLAILHSTFEEILFLDADCYPVREFEQDCFASCRSGLLVWPDLVDCDRNLKWDAHGLTPDGMPGLLGGRYVIRKRLAWQVLQLAAWIDSHSTYYYRHQHGDQDSVRAAIRRLGFAADQVGGRPRIVNRAYVERSPGSPATQWVHRHNCKFGFNNESFSRELPREIEAFGYWLDFARI